MTRGEGGQKGLLYKYTVGLNNIREFVHPFLLYCWLQQYKRICGPSFLYGMNAHCLPSRKVPI